MTRLDGGCCDVEAWTGMTGEVGIREAPAGCSACFSRRGLSLQTQRDPCWRPEDGPRRYQPCCTLELMRSEGEMGGGMGYKGDLSGGLGRLQIGYTDDGGVPFALA